MSKLYFECDFHSEELRSLELPIEVRKPNLALVARTLSSQPLELEPGIYHVTATLPAGQELYNRVEVEEGKDATAILIPELEDVPPNERQEVQHYIWNWPGTTFQASDSNEQSLEIVPTRIRAFRGNILQGKYNVRDDQNWLAAVPIAQSSTATELKVRAGSTRLVQLLHPGVPPINIALPVSQEQGCQLVLTRLSNGQYSIDCNIEHLVANVLLKYLQRGFLAQAATMTTSHALEAEQLLFQKRQDPIAASIGAYALLRLGNIKQLHNWTENLRNWFIWLPDGSAIRGEHLARLGAHDKALEVFLELPSRGLPLFSDGLSYVIDRLRLYINIGKRYFEEKKLSQAQALLEQLQRFAIFIDFRQPLLTFTGIDPGKPDDNPFSADIWPYAGVTIHTTPSPDLLEIYNQPWMQDAGPETSEHYQQARRYLERSLALGEGLINEAETITILGALVEETIAEGDYAAGDRYLERRVELLIQQGDRRQASVVLFYAGLAIYEQLKKQDAGPETSEHYQQARRYLERSLALGEGLINEAETITILEALVDVTIAEGDQKATDQYVERVVELLIQGGDQKQASAFLFHVGQALYKQLEGGESSEDEVESEDEEQESDTHE